MVAIAITAYSGGALIPDPKILGPGQVLQCRTNQFESATKDTTNWLAHIPEHIAWTLLSILLPGRVQKYERTDIVEVWPSAEPGQHYLYE